jgi:predicted N-acyltransferase
MMTFRTITLRSIGQVNLEDWNKICDSRRDFLMHPGLLAAAEASMGNGGGTLFWYLLAYREEEPVGAACVTEYPLDTMLFASPLAQRVVANVRRLFPRYLKFRVTFCGLPISIAGSNLRVVAGVDAAAVVRALNERIEQISRERNTWLVIFKELNRHEAELLAPLQSLGFVRAESLPMNLITNEFGSFDARSRKKLSQSGCAVHRLRGRASIERLYTPKLHAMYEGVVRRAEHRLEILPRTFFLELAERFPEELVFTTVTHGAEVLAFAWSVLHGRIYRNLFVGIDYNSNEETDAYFNLMIEDTAHAMEQSVDVIFVGQSADEFKSRIGCTPDPRFLYIRVTNRLLRWCFLKMKSSFLTPPTSAQPRDVFKRSKRTIE